MEKIHRQAKTLFLALITLVVARLLLVILEEVSLLSSSLETYIFLAFVILGFAFAVLAAIFAIALPFWILKERASLSWFHRTLLFVPLASLASLLIAFLASHFIGEPSYAVTTVSDSERIARAVTATALFVPYNLVPIAAVAALIRYFYTRRQDKIILTIFYTLTSLMATLLVCFFLISVMSFDRGGKSYDAKRISDLKQLHLALDLYHDDFGTYPVVRESASHKHEQTLKILVTEGYIAHLPIEPYEERNYTYQGFPDGSSYILRAILDNTDHVALDSDIDGKVGDVFCGEQGSEREYCIGPR